jgi:lipopolysaccharide export system permease protein
LLSTTDRYFIKEIALTFGATLLVLLAMVLTHRLARYLGQAAGGLLAQDSILLLLGLQAIRYLVVLVPLAFLLAIMLALGRLHRDSEMVALRACGFGPGALYRPLFLMAIPVAMVLAELSFSVVPLAMKLQQELQIRARQEAEITVFQPGAFRKIADERHVVYVGGLHDDNRELSDIFIYSLMRGGGSVITTGKRGTQRIDTETGVRYIIINNGHRYEGDPLDGDYNIVSFDQLTVRVDAIPKSQQRLKLEALPTDDLLASDNLELRAELHRRISGPLSMLIIAFIAPLLANARPREGRYGRIVAAVLIYTIYVNLLGVGQTWLERGIIPEPLGLWWAHAALLLLGGLLWYIHYGHSGKPGKPWLRPRRAL